MIDIDKLTKHDIEREINLQKGIRHFDLPWVSNSSFALELVKEINQKNMVTILFFDKENFRCIVHDDKLVLVPKYSTDAETLELAIGKIWLLWKLNEKP